MQNTFAGYPEPTDNGVPDYADPDSDAYTDRPRFDDPGPLLAEGRPLGMDEYGVTTYEARHREPLDAKLSREVPDRPPRAARGEVSRLVEERDLSKGGAEDRGGLVDDRSEETAGETGEPGEAPEETAMHYLDPRRVPYHREDSYLGPSDE